MTLRTIIVDPERCSNCSLCVIACKDEFVGNEHAPWSAPQPDVGQFWIDVKRMERGTAPRLKVSFMPVSCQHCETPACRTACPTGAIKQREDGLTWIDSTLCDGCGLCVEACPYDAVSLDPDRGLAQKCTGCAHRVDAGELPRCVEICPHDVFEFVDVASNVLAAENLSVLNPEYDASARVLWRNLPQPRIAGAVVDPKDDDVVEGALVTVSGAGMGEAQQIFTDAFGQFAIERLPSGIDVEVIISKNGYLPWETRLATDRDQDLGDVELQRQV